MRSRGDLRHDAAEAPVQLVLRGDDRGEHRQLVGDHGRRRLVAGGLDREDVQGITSGALVR